MRSRSSPSRPSSFARGGELDDAEPDPVDVARTICLRLLTGAPRTRAQLADALRRRHVPQEVADHVLGRLSEVGLIDDRAFAEAWVTSRHLGRGLGRRALAAELQARGVPSETVAEAVGALDPEAELQTARALVSRRLPATRGQAPQVRTRRLVAMLCRKGYSPGSALQVVREVLATEAPGQASGAVDEIDAELGSYDPELER